MSWGFIVLLVLAVLLYGVMAMNIATSGASDLAGNGMTTAFAAIFGLAFWIVTLILLLMARHGLPHWAAIIAFIALPVAPILSIVAVVRGWPKLVPILLPLPFLAAAGLGALV
jgi:hypothetical protein